MKSMSTLERRLDRIACDLLKQLDPKLAAWMLQQLSPAQITRWAPIFVALGQGGALVDIEEAEYLTGLPEFPFPPLSADKIAAMDAAIEATIKAYARY
jgi:hypothetical protein